MSATLKASTVRFVVQTPAMPAPAPPPAAPDPLATLQKLKGMMDADLITAAEYETKKAAILASM